MNGEITTVKELYIFCKGKFDNIETAIEDIKKSPDMLGRWIIRFAIIGTMILQAVLLYKTFK